MKKISLREITLDDTKNIIKWRNNENVKKNFCIQDDLTVQIHEKWFNTKICSGEVKQFIIRDEEQKKDIGSTYLRDIDFQNKKAEFGIFIGDDSDRGKGIGSESVRLTVKYAFNELNLHKVYLRVFEDNINAIKAYEKTGFKYAGTAKDDIVLPNNKYQNLIFMEIINE